MRELEKYIWAASIISFLALIYYQATSYGLFGDNEFSEIKRRFNSQIFLTIFMGYAHQIACSFWLYWAAKKESLSKPAWAIFGLAFGLVSVAIFYSANIYYLLKRIKKPVEENAKKT